MYNKLHLNYNEGNLEVRFTNKFSKKYHSFCKSFKGSFFSAQNEMWIVPRFLTRDFCREARKKGYYLDLSKEIQDEFGVDKNGYSKKEIEKEKAWLENHDSNLKDDKNFNEEILEMPYPLLPYQRAGISYFTKPERNGRGLLADDMGLGKTIQGIGFLKYYKKDWPAIVVAPASLLLNWKKEICKWLPKDLDEDDVVVMKKTKDKPSGKIVVCSYNYAAKNQFVLSKFLGVKGCVVVDEAHNIKNLEAQRTKAIVAIGHRAKRYLPMTGTPLLNKPAELFSILHSIDPVTWDIYEKFVFEYCDGQRIKIKRGKVNTTALIANGISNHKKLFRKLRNEIMCRRLKKDVLTQLPPKRRYTLSLDATTQDVNQTQEYLELYKTIICKGLIENNFDLEQTKRFVLSEKSVDVSEGLFQAYQLTGKAKIKSLCQWVKEKLEGETNKLIIFGHHEEFLDKIQEQIEKINSTNKNKDSVPLGYIRIDGKTKKEKRFEYQEKFQNDDSCHIALLSIGAANSGLTLTSSSTVIMGELPWTPGVSRQAEDRVHRIGQENDVDIFYTIADETLDGALWEMLKNKSEMASAILDNNEGDEMDEDINVNSTDLLTALLLQVYQDHKRGNIDINEYASRYKKQINKMKRVKKEPKKKA